MGHPRLSVILRDPHAEHTGSLYAQVIDPVICDYRFELREGRNAGILLTASWASQQRP